MQYPGCNEEMSEWDGRERRMVSADYKEVIERLGTIDVKIGIVETKVDGLKDTNNIVKNELREHGILDRWVQGTLLAVLLAIFGKVFFK